MSSNYARRRRRVREWLEANGVDALLVTSAPNVRYLFGFGGEGIAVVGDDAVVCTDRRFELEADEIPGRVEVSVHPDGHLTGAIDYVRGARAKRVAFEAEGTSYASYENLTAKLDGVKVLPSRKVIEEHRAQKDKAEVEAISRAAAIMDEALTDIAQSLEPGCSEKELALDLERAALLAGADKMAFDTIVAFGPSAAHPHALPGDRKLEPGQMVKIDCGVKLDGYCSDMTRTLILGEPDERYKQVYGAVFDAQRAAVAAAKPRLKAGELDAVAREIIKERGFGEHFSHGLGHGVGLEVHELPKVGARSDETLKAGMVITIEPGVYIEGWGGVRIEDTVVLTRSGCEVLTHAPKQEPDW